MVVLSHHTFRWSLTWRMLKWTVAIVLGGWFIAVTGSAYGLWATKKMMNFWRLQKETQREAVELRTALEQAQTLEQEVLTLRQQHGDLLKLLDPKAPKADLPSAPAPNGQVKNTLSVENLATFRDGVDQRLNQARAIRTRMEPILWRWSHTPSTLPTAGYLSSGFGMRLNPFQRIGEEDGGLLGSHTGLDICNEQGTPIQATADGEVVHAGWFEAYGNAVLIRHQTNLETLYAHLERVEVGLGQQVHRGDILGRMGRSGRATGVHLHYEVRIGGTPVNPTPYLRLQKTWLSDLKK
jgi:murein DD-endopeptidase MepM/ murein hydrolase activator NlpD